MEREELLAEVTRYFGESDHWFRLCAALYGDAEPHGSHIHGYVDTSVHPESLEALIAGYFGRLGWPSSRKIDHLSAKVGTGSLHGIEPRGKPHFDFQWSFKKDVGLRASEGGESGCNLLVWNRWYINQFYTLFDFRHVGPNEVEALRDYFKSDHFLKGLEFPVMPTTTHTHINVHSSVHPDHLQKYAEEALQREGMRIDYTCPNVFLLGDAYRGKLVFMGKEPEVVFDIAWKYTPEAVIEPACETWLLEANAGYDVWTTDMLAEALREDFVALTEEEIKEALDRCTFQK